MALLNIPEEDIEALFTFSQLPDEIKIATFDRLNVLQLGESPKDISKEISNQFDIDFQDIIPTITVFFVLIATIHKNRLTKDEVVSEIINNIVEQDFDFDAEDIKAIEEIIVSFIGIESKVPLITSLANSLANTNHSIYLSSIINQDLRPVILDDQVAGTALYHTLKLHIRREDQSHTDLFITFDKDDIEDLIKQLTSAKDKVNLLKDHYGDSLIVI